MELGLRKISEDSVNFSLFHPPKLPSPEVSVLPSSKPFLRCVVCGDSSSGKHYGVLACNGCSGFFKRSVRRNLLYRCQAASGDCIVDKAHRNQCQSCRFKKCLDCGMNRDAVQNERQPRNSATVRSDFSSFSPITKPYARASPPTMNSSTMADITVGVFSPFFTLPSKVFPSSSFNLSTKYHHQRGENSTTVTEFALARKSDLEEPPTLSATSPKDKMSDHPDLVSVHETSSHILLMTIRWARNFPSYSSLCLDDQLILLEETWSDLFLLSALQWGLPLEANPLFSAPRDRSDDVLKHLHTLQKAASRLQILGTDLAEFACLKAIVLFKPDTALLKESYQVEMLQDHAMLMLAQHIKTQHVDYTFRYGHLLLILPTLRQIPPKIVETFFFGNIIGSTSMEKFLSDLFKR